MSYEITSWAWQQDELPATAKYALLALADYANEKGECWPSIGSLAAKMGYSPESRKTIRKGLAQLEERGLVTYSGRLRKGSREQTSHMYRIHWKAPAVKETQEVGVNSPYVGVSDPNGRGSQPHESVNEPINEPITSPTPSPLRDEGLKTPDAIEHSSTVTEGFAKDEARLKALTLTLARSTEDNYQEHAEQFVEAFVNIYGTGNGVKDVEDMFWNKGYDDRLYSLITKAQHERGEERGIQYGAAQWLSTFTNDLNY